MTALTPPAPGGPSGPGASATLGTSSAPIAPLRGGRVPRPNPVGGALAAYEHMWLLYRRTWRGSIFGSFAQPVLFLVAMGIGLGSYVNQANPSSLQGVPYLQFLAPALLVSTVMQGATFEATFPVLGGFRWVRRYHAMYATPLGPYAIAFGQIAWIATRATLVASIFALVILLFNAAPTLGILLAIPVGTLTALAFASWIAAYMTTQYDTTSFNAIWRFGITPLFLFSGTFFPIDQLPAQIQWVAWLLPLWHGVALARALSLGIVMDNPWLNLAHLVILLVLATVGTVAMFFMYRRQLAK